LHPVLIEDGDMRALRRVVTPGLDLSRRSIYYFESDVFALT